MIRTLASMLCLMWLAPAQPGFRGPFEDSAPPAPPAQPPAPVEAAAPVEMPEPAAPAESPSDATASDKPMSPAETPMSRVRKLLPLAATPPEPKELEADRIVAALAGDAAVEVDPAERARLLESALGRNGTEMSALDVLDDDVERLRETLSGLVGQGEDTAQVLGKVKSFDDELESIGVSAELSDQIRDLYPQVAQLRGELKLQQLRAKTTAGLFRPVDEITAPAQPVPRADGSAAAIAPDQPAAEPAKPKHSRFPLREALLAFEQGDSDAVLETLLPLPQDQLSPECAYALGAVLVSRRRFDEARLVLEPLAHDDKRRVLAAAATRQLDRIFKLTTGIVDLHPLDQRLQRDETDAPAHLSADGPDAAVEIPPSRPVQPVAPATPKTPNAPNTRDRKP